MNLDLKLATHAGTSDVGTSDVGTSDAGTSDAGTSDLSHPLRQYCHGMPPLSARLEHWMQVACEDPRLADWVDQFGSPLNLIQPTRMDTNIHCLNRVAQQRRLDFRVFFARKANKCLSLVDQAAALDAGIDTASLPELDQVLQRDIPSDRIICTAAIKDTALLTRCVQSQVTVVIDNDDEARRLASIARAQGTVASVAVRISGFEHDGKKLESRFGFDLETVTEWVESFFDQSEPATIRLDGVHFHLDGYDARQRVSAIKQSLHWIDHLRAHGHHPRFLDIGGGFPMCYLESASQWDEFWQQLRQTLLAGDDAVAQNEITYRNHGLGLMAIGNQLHGRAMSYPYWQQPVQHAWLEEVLDAPIDGQAVSEAIGQRSLQLRCEPGRSLLDGCGVTVARVEFCKRAANDTLFIGLAMNGTQCRSGPDYFLVDPIVVPCQRPQSNQDRTPGHGRGQDHAVDGYLVGAYCTEFDLLSIRKLRFPRGIGAGDLVVFPNTAGYLMHFMESRSHQFPLAKNVVLDSTNRSMMLDPIEQLSSR